jgi:hypothetical protein
MGLRGPWPGGGDDFWGGLFDKFLLEMGKLESGTEDNEHDGPY